MLIGASYQVFCCLVLFFGSPAMVTSMLIQDGSSWHSAESETIITIVIGLLI